MCSSGCGSPVMNFMGCGSNSNQNGNSNGNSYSTAVPVCGGNSSGCCNGGQDSSGLEYYRKLMADVNNMNGSSGSCGGGNGSGNFNGNGNSNGNCNGNDNGGFSFNVSVMDDLSGLSGCNGMPGAELQSSGIFGGGCEKSINGCSSASLRRSMCCYLAKPTTYRCSYG